ncbi:hypothetical protein ACFWHQ_07760 [Streptomyces sp. NPDC060334]|uniref:DUF7639 domain-containing protein n=1 Tax=Streptomyces sp. NPDC060334 TaxID=3347099 RepID=UPI00365792BE
MRTNGRTPGREHLTGGPDSTARCLAAVDVFMADRTEDNRAAARAAYLAVPETVRRCALGDMDRKDHPLRVLVQPGARFPRTSTRPGGTRTPSAVRCVVRRPIMP